ncbi:hypothetical protein [Niveibacterium sp.]|uniref:hypothetical protein n=1 Tax=Niveibacterium sp. TaxID=2017444 RepID=UPI0035B2FCDF
MHKPLAIAVALALVPAAHAAEGRFDWLAVSGFGTIGASMTDDDNIAFRYPFQKNAKANQWATDIDSRVGAQFDINRGGTFSGVLQVMGQQREDGDFSFEVEWANAMWTINENWRVRAGRMVTPVFMQSDYQNVGYALIPVRYSPEMSGNYPLSRHDGAEVIFGSELGPGRIQLQAYGGTTRYATSTLEYKADAVYGAAATYTWNDWTFRASATGVKLKVVGSGATSLTTASNIMAAVPSAVCPACAEESKKFADIVEGADGTFFGLGTMYDDGTWYALGEVGIRKASAAIPDTMGYQLLGAYRWRTLTPFVSVSGYKTDSNNQAVLPTSLGALAAGVNGLYESFATDRTTFSVGTRWDFYRNVALKLQADFVDHKYPERQMSGAWPRTTTGPTAYDGKVNLYTATLDFVF